MYIILLLIEYTIHTAIPIPKHNIIVCAHSDSGGKSDGWNEGSEKPHVAHE